MAEIPKYEHVILNILTMKHSKVHPQLSLSVINY